MSCIPNRTSNRKCQKGSLRQFRKGETVQGSHRKAPCKPHRDGHARHLSGDAIAALALCKATPPLVILPKGASCAANQPMGAVHCIPHCNSPVTRHPNQTAYRDSQCVVGSHIHVQPLFYILQGVVPFLAGTHFYHIFHLVHEDFAIANVSGVESRFGSFDNSTHRYLANDDFHFDLR